MRSDEGVRKDEVEERPVPEPDGERDWLPNPESAAERVAARRRLDRLADNW